MTFIECCSDLRRYSLDKSVSSGNLTNDLHISKLVHTHKQNYREGMGARLHYCDNHVIMKFYSKHLFLREHELPNSLHLLRLFANIIIPSEL